MTDCIGAAYDRFTKPVDVTITIDGKDYEVSNWMELVHPLSGSEEAPENRKNSGTDITSEPDSAQDSPCEIWAHYNHKYWGKYASITHHAFGKGTATYLGCFLEKDGCKALLKRLFFKAEIDLPDIAFPVIRKSGTNEDGNTVSYYFNYSSEPHSFIYKGAPARNLLNGETVADGEQIELKDWDVIILEEMNCK